MGFFKKIRKATKGVAKKGMSVLGGGKSPKLPTAAAPPAVDAGIAAQEEYDKRYAEMLSARTKDLSSMKARLAAGGIAEDSAGWGQGLSTITSSYEEKLQQLGADPYFSKATKKSSWV